MAHSNTRLLNIAFQGGTHGNFLKYFIDRFSALTPELTELPFTFNGTCHKLIKYSESIERYHPEDNDDKFKNINEAHVLITVAPGDLLFLHRIVNERIGDMKIDLNLDLITTSADYIDDYGLKDKFKYLYNREINENIKIPKFIFRDYLKLAFLDTNKDGFIEKNTLYLSRRPAVCSLFPLNAFWNKDLFFSNIHRINQELNLKLIIDRDSECVYDLFVKNIKQYDTRNRCETIIHALENGENIDISDIDTVEQAYLSAWIEKNYKFVIVPVSNGFFKNTGEILSWLEWYPQHYMAMNPNLPTFNGIPNPFHLHNLKK